MLDKIQQANGKRNEDTVKFPARQTEKDDNKER